MAFDTFARPGRFHRGNLHTHSNRSDGVLDPAEVCRRYRAQGYDFIALTDHMLGLYGYPLTDTSPLRGEGFTTLLGAELHSGAMSNGEIWHILAVGLPADFDAPNAPDYSPCENQESGPELAARAVRAGAFVAIAHPQWSGMTLADACSIEAAHAVEVYNHGCAVGCDRADGFQIADLLWSQGRSPNLVATDDAHFTEPDHFGGWVMVKAVENEPEALLAALKAGDFYSSQGPEFHHVEIDGDAVCIRCSAVVTVIAQGAGCAAKALHGESMTGIRMPLDHVGRSAWIRFTIVDRAGRRAWTNPVRLKQ
ncbi:PHP domain-containing protein [Fulvimarina sp. 2208YS6-2-32]|uniref:PHP domain-containing protein n=1 Tax=Fulvimarina uroteuthidis TaxID=3098149 RepID=A0ABU5I0Y6_9HYPH|nr:PHP domain-containing protein [Fulvimarina sp. 2208YS6-2-32]MDY8109012.1 PHP domain-containing protein [Fulvimarina sp. 2208YS6-2-32]